MTGPGRLSRLEDRIESLVEGTFARLFSGYVQPRDVAVQLARALEDSAAAGAPGTHYTVRLNPADAQKLLAAHPDLAERLSIELLGLAREARLTLAHPPEVSVAADPAQAAHTVTVSARRTSTAPSVTQSMAAAPAAARHAAPRAFVILDGQHTITLREAVVNLGRRLDNQIIIDDPRVSRKHAQLRLRFGHYVIYNLGSSGGTFVNSRRIEECVLRPGDVISLGGVALIYGEDSSEPGPPARGAHSTMPLTPPADLPADDDQP